MDKLQEFNVLIASLTGLTIIAANQAKKLPSYPFITYQSTSVDRESVDILTSELINGGLDIIETQNKRVEDIVQYDIYGSSIAETKEKARELVNAIEFIHRETLIENGFGIVDVGTIINNDSLQQVKTFFRRTVDITIEYGEAVQRTVENMQSVSYEVNEEAEEETVSRE